MLHRPLRVAIALPFAVAGLFAASTGSAQTAPNKLCSTLPNPLYGAGGSATKPLLGKLATALGAANPPVSIVYQSPGACTGFGYLLNGTKITGTASYWDATGKETPCDLTPTVGDDVQFANTGNSAALCPGVTDLPAEIGDFLGPVTNFNFIVPKASTQTSISGPAAYFVLGKGAAGQVEPWTDEQNIFRRDANSAVQIFIGLASKVPAGKFIGIDTKNNLGTVNGVADSKKPEAAIGIVSGEVADQYRDKVRTLAYQHYGQSCGYWPDSTADALDKRNVRTGQYYIWAPIHFFAKVKDGKIVNPEAAKFIGYFTGEVAAPAGVDLIALEAKAGSVPKCAMEVWRKTDLDPLESYAPPEPCGCKFEKAATGATSCQACDSDNACSASAPHCRYGYCEVN